jgi:hypothetical protein
MHDTSSSILLHCTHFIHCPAVFGSLKCWANKTKVGASRLSGVNICTT